MALPEGAWRLGERQLVGLWASADSGATAYSAKPPRNRGCRHKHHRQDEIGDSGSDSSTCPAMSEPSVRCRGARSPPIRAYIGVPGQPLPVRAVDRSRDNPDSTWFAPGDGIGTSSTRSTSGGPYRSKTTPSYSPPSGPRQVIRDMPTGYEVSLGGRSQEFGKEGFASISTLELTINDCAN